MVNNAIHVISRLSVLCVLAMMSLTVQAQTAQTVYAYINRYKHLAIQHEQQYRIPASITMAQGILESGCGQSGLARKANNHFGIKAGRNWGKGVYKAKDDEIGLSSFRTYASAEQSYLDHALLLADPKGYYTRCFQYDVTNYRAWAYMLKKCGYASAPDYAESLISYIERYRLYELTTGGYCMPAGQKTRMARTTRITYKIVKREVVVYDTITVDATPEEIETNEKFVEMKMDKEEVPYWRGPRNGLWCTILYPGQTLDDIVIKNKIPKTKILEYNEINGEDQIKTGDIVFLQKKRNKYKESQDIYYVREGENLHDVAQTFGIKVASLAKINDITPETAIKTGDKLWLK